MSGNMNENNAQDAGNNMDKDPLKNLTNNLLNNQNSFDLSSIMRVATTLLNNESIINSFTELNKQNQTPAPSTAPEKQENAELASLSEQLEKLSNDFSELKKELLELKELNNYMIKIFKKLYDSKKK
ncbi:hypothetical protein PH210_03940 [Paenibacillus sp. BSR1-1]|uniref:hypothetical protein n=1 Tax=Paenibacillus sp. BSR1-1 TaxID=3020845 RepID=UPI0025B12671|nr:hypothetical protein [Paenibacillus sp. BSR1-1]MDN3015358.1 hypothetical protein [Paenibacillus sp. BSR1-1]